MDNKIYLEYCSVLKTYNHDKKIRLGNSFDGGYVIANVGGYDCYISAGIGLDESFSSDFINKFNPNNSYAFDGTIEDIPHNFPSKLNFVKQNVSENNNNFNTNLLYLFKKHNNIFLKMDIEGGEIKWFNFINSNKINKIKQMVIEFHYLDLKKNKVIKCLNKICKTHYIIHVHGNNYAPVKNLIPTVIELTFLRKTEFSSEPKLNISPLPSELDYKNNPNIDEIILNYPPFFHSN